MSSTTFNTNARPNGLLRAVTGVIPALLMMFAVSFAHAADGVPSDGAKGMPGALGTFEFKPSDHTGKDSWWTDSDGVKPGKAGCHIGTDEKGKRNDRFFGEACSDGILVESNPGKNKLHMHAGDLGHPDKFDCKQWCVGTKKGSGGVCKEVEGPAPCKTSARCECSK